MFLLSGGGDFWIWILVYFLECLSKPICAPLKVILFNEGSWRHVRRVGFLVGSIQQACDKHAMRRALNVLTPGALSLTHTLTQ